ncbi:glycosyltransferase family 4 protein [Bacillus sp. V5-8f]|uniref:glycosyltransferase family 4 protein n=1 Tax=Bacillus sp. V5-8f TaxID=2053044 RepID=UPI000C763DDC|nr:glycosyltransferase family 4 protein [Bacillus sp. V5-8f]PLT35523.1 glycosyltransferase family 1 protein [Bacillus sp. V5-8f]
MKILMICTEKLPVPAVLGGAIQTYISGALPYLSKHYDITVLGITDPSLPDKETISGVHYVRVPGQIFEVYREAVVRYVESNEFDLIHIFNRPRLVLPIRKAAPHSKITLSMHNDMFKREKIDPEEANEALNEIAGIVTVSDYIGNVIRELYPQASSKIRTIYSGVDHNRFLPGSHPKMQSIRSQLRKDHGLENKTVILFAGRLSPNKGVDKLVRALPELSNKFKDLALVIVGSKWFSQEDTTDFIAYVRALSKKLPVPVVATGFVSPDQIQNWFAAADIFVCTSIWQEPLARVHYEAMAAGLPIITTARGGNPEVIQPGENGLVVENAEDPAAFTEKISTILSNKPLMKQMGEKGRQLAIKEYNWERVATDILEVWKAAMNWSTEALSDEEALETVEDLNIEDSIPETAVIVNDELNPKTVTNKKKKQENKKSRVQNEKQNTDSVTRAVDLTVDPVVENTISISKSEGRLLKGSDPVSQKDRFRESLRDMLRQSIRNSLMSSFPETATMAETFRESRRKLRK